MEEQPCFLLLLTLASFPSLAKTGKPLLPSQRKKRENTVFFLRVALRGFVYISYGGGGWSQFQRQKRVVLFP